MCIRDSYWTEGSEWEGAARYRGDPARWQVRGAELHEVDGERVVYADTSRGAPILRVQPREAAD
jgi:hypothetical protein